MEEIWKDIQEYEGLYEVSNLGRVRSKDRTYMDSKGRVYSKQGKILKQTMRQGYLFVGLYKDGKMKNKSVARLVAIAFIPNPQNLPQVHHIDEAIPSINNKVTNLQWVTAKQNCNSKKHLERLSGENASFYGRKHTEASKRKISEHHADFTLAKHPRAKKVICEDIIYNTITECAIYYGVSDTTLNSYLRGHDIMPPKWKEKGLSYYQEDNK